MLFAADCVGARCFGIRLLHTLLLLALKRFVNCFETCFVCLPGTGRFVTLQCVQNKETEVKLSLQESIPDSKVQTLVPSSENSVFKFASAGPPLLESFGNQSLGSLITLKLANVSKVSKFGEVAFGNQLMFFYVSGTTQK